MHVRGLWRPQGRCYGLPLDQSAFQGEEGEEPLGTSGRMKAGPSFSSLESAEQRDPDTRAALTQRLPPVRRAWSASAASTSLLRFTDLPWLVASFAIPSQ